MLSGQRAFSGDIGGRHDDGDSGEGSAGPAAGRAPDSSRARAHRRPLPREVAGGAIPDGRRSGVCARGAVLIFDVERSGRARERSRRRCAQPAPAWLLAGAASVASLLVGIPTALYVAIPPTSEPVVTRLDVVTPPTGDPFSFALSPDGRQLVFVANGEKVSQLWLRPFDQATAQPLAGTEAATYPFWAPDSRAVGFFADGRLKRLDLGGVRRRCSPNAPTARGGTWNADRLVVFAPITTGGLMQVSATGGTPTPVTTPGSRPGEPSLASVPDRRPASALLRGIGTGAGPRRLRGVARWRGAGPRARGGARGLYRIGTAAARRARRALGATIRSRNGAGRR